MDRTYASSGEMILKNVTSIIAISLALASTIAGICVWSYTTFATKEQVSAVSSLVDSNKKDMLSLIDNNKRDSQDMVRQIQISQEKMQLQFSQAMSETKREVELYSDKNRQGMEQGFSALKDMFLDLKEEVRSGTIRPVHRK